MNAKAHIPKLHLIAKRLLQNTDSGVQYWWSVTMLAPDAKGERILGYRASGLVVEEADNLRVQFDQEPQVHDEKRPVWTTMNPTDRSDIRKSIVRLTKFAVEQLKKSGEDSFEHIKR